MSPSSATMFNSSSSSLSAIPNSAFFAPDFLLGVGVVIIQPATNKILLVSDERGRWFLPKGRKDKGESMEQAALREGYEESGYRFEFLPLYSGSCAPDAPGSTPLQKDTEPIFVTAFEISPGSHGRTTPGEYFTFYYVGQIAENAIREENTGMANEASFVSHLLSIDEALDKLSEFGTDVQRHVVDVAWTTWQKTISVDEEKLHSSL